MKKRILVLGGSMFINTELHNNNYRVLPNKIVRRINEKFNMDNLSNSALTINKSILYAKEFIKTYNYDSCIIALGEADINNISVNTFKDELIELIGILKTNNVVPLLVSLPKDLQKDDTAHEFQGAIDEVAKIEDVHYIYNGDSNLYTNNIVKNESQMKRMIVNFCL